MDQPVRTARLTGVAYLGLAVFGILGTLVIRPQLHVPADPGATLTNLVDNSTLAHALVAFELLVVLTQALTAVGFYALFRSERPVAAFSVAVFGMANAAALLGSAAMVTTASALADGDASADAAPLVDMLFTVSDAFWTAGGLFFGLWLFPMGWYVLSTDRMPRLLGWFLVAGAVLYVLGTLADVVAPTLPVGGALVAPVTVAELWMVGYLLVRGIRPAERIGQAPQSSTA